MRFEVLGTLQVRREGEAVALRSGRQRALLANLLIAGGRTVAADKLIESVWGDDLPSNPANTLQHGIAQLRKLLEPQRRRGEEPVVVVSEAGGYRLDLDGHELDGVEFTDSLAQARRLLDDGDPTAAADLIRSAGDLWRGNAYSDFTYEGFARAEAERLHELRVQGRELLVDAVVASQGPNAAVADLESLVIEFPYREGLWSRLMRALYQTGRQAEALRVFGEARRVLADDLGLTPSPELAALEEQILIQDPALDRVKAEPERHNLPSPATRLIGREQLLGEAVEFVRGGRLTTLLGPGGSGKTRLAIEIGHQLKPDRPDGVWLVRLDDLDDPDLLAASIGSIVGMPEDRDKAVIDTLCDHLARSRALLILDNCEHLVEPVAATVQALLAACPDLVILATSQEALDMTGEQRVLVPPLAVPGDTDSPFEDLWAVPAVELFVTRATAVNPDLDLGTISMAAVANIVAALDGMPLAIVLAAGRSDLMTTTEIARRLGDRLEILGDGPRDVPQRQRSLRQTVEWSYSLLEPAEQRFFASLSVFAGTFDIEAAAAVTGVDESEAIDMVGRLHRRSLVLRSSEVRQRSRFRLLETLRVFGNTVLAEQREAARDAHLAHFARRALAHDVGLSGFDQMEIYHTAVADQDNYRAALTWSLAGAGTDSARLDDGVRIVARNGRLWDWNGSLAEALTWSRRFLDAVDGDGDGDFSLLVAWAGYYEWELGNDEAAARLVAHARQIAERTNDDYAVAIATSGIALQARVHGEESLSHNDIVRKAAQRCGSEWMEVWADNHDSLSLLAAGDVDGSEQAANASLAGFRRLGDLRATGWALTVIAQVALERGDHARAIELGMEAMRLSCDLGDGRNAAWAMELAAAGASAAGDDTAAAAYDAEANRLLKERGTPRSPWHH